MVGGVAAAIGAAMLGPRIGKYDKNGKPHAILGHSITLGALGVFILWFGWFWIQPWINAQRHRRCFIALHEQYLCVDHEPRGSGRRHFDDVSYPGSNTKNLMFRYTLNGALGGLVAITAGCDARCLLLDPSSLV